MNLGIYSGPFRQMESGANLGDLWINPVTETQLSSLSSFLLLNSLPGEAFSVDTEAQQPTLQEPCA